MAGLNGVIPRFLFGFTCFKDKLIKNNNVHFSITNKKP